MTKVELNIITRANKYAPIKPSENMDVYYAGNKGYRTGATEQRTIDIEYARQWLIKYAKDYGNLSRGDVYALVYDLTKAMTEGYEVDND